MNNKIRKPIQKRSIEKRARIIESGFELICKKGYYNTNTAEIAKAAGVSTGIVYQYFNDKHDILIESIRLYGNRVFYPIIEITEKTFDAENIDILLKEIIDKFIENHKLSKISHEEIMAMSHSDSDVAILFANFEIEITNNITNLLLENGIKTENLREKVHICINLIDDLCHEIVYHKHPSMDYNEMINIVVAIIENTIKN